MIDVEILTAAASFPARDQGRRRTCLAFASCSIEQVYAPEHADLSPEYFYRSAASLMPNWRPDIGLSIAAALGASSKVALESDCPYEPNDPPYPLPALPSGLPLFGAQASSLRVDAACLVDYLRSGRSAVLGMKLTTDFYCPSGGRVTDAGSVVPDSGHAVAVVGLGWEGAVAQFLVLNSWGASWGDRGRAWISADYFRAHALCLFGA